MHGNYYILLGGLQVYPSTYKKKYDYKFFFIYNLEITLDEDLYNKC